MEPQGDGWLAMEEAAALAGKTDRTIRSWVRQGRLIKRKIGKRVLVRFAEGYEPSGPPPGTPWRPVVDAGAVRSTLADYFERRSEEGAAVRVARLEGQLAERQTELDLLRREQQSQQRAVADHLSRAAAQRERLRLAEEQLEALHSELEGQRQQLFSTARRIGHLEGETREQTRLLELHRARDRREVSRFWALGGSGAALTILIALALALFQAQDQYLAAELEASFLEARAREQALRRSAENGRPIPEARPPDPREFFLPQERIGKLLRGR